MVLPRINASRVISRSAAVRASRPAARIRPCRQIGRRTYATHGSHETKKSSSDLPWLIGALVVTVPSCAYLLQSSPSKGHDHEQHDRDIGHGSEDQGEHEGTEEHGEQEGHEEQAPDAEQGAGEGAEGDGADAGEAKAEAGAQQGGETDEGDGGDDKSEGSESNEGEAQDTPDTSDDEATKGSVTTFDDMKPGVQFKAPTTKGPAPDTRMDLPDSKAPGKRRIDSDLKISQGKEDNPVREGERGSLKDKAATSKPALDQNQQSGKQEGWSNTDTRHSTDISSSPDKSTKPEGGPDTGKVKGTVDPRREAK